MNTGLKKAYQESKQVDAFCTGRAHVPLPVYIPSLFCKVERVHIMAQESLFKRSCRSAL